MYMLLCIDRTPMSLCNPLIISIFSFQLIAQIYSLQYLQRNLKYRGHDAVQIWKLTVQSLQENNFYPLCMDYTASVLFLVVTSLSTFLSPTTVIYTTRKPCLFFTMIWSVAFLLRKWIIQYIRWIFVLSLKSSVRFHCIPKGVTK